MTSRLTIVIQDNGATAKAVLTDRGNIETPGRPFGLNDIDPATNQIPIGAEIGDYVGIKGDYYSLDTNPVRYSITSQSPAGYLAVDSITGVVTAPNPSALASGASGTVTIRSVDQSTGLAVSETYSYTVTV